LPPTPREATREPSALCTQLGERKNPRNADTLRIGRSQATNWRYTLLVAALDELLATIRRLPLPERLRLIEQATLEAAEDTPKPAGIAERGRTLSVDEFLAARLTPPPGVGPVSLQDMDRAIAEGASGRGSV